MRDRIFYAICFGFLTGVLLRSFILVNLYFITLLLGISFALFLFFFVVSQYKWGIIFTIFIFSACLGVFRFHFVDVSAPQVFESKVSLPTQTGQKISLLGEVVTEPSIGSTNQKLIIETKIGQDSTKILLTVGFDEDFRYGDEVNFKGVLKKPENFKTDQGKVFDYVNYLRKDGILYTMSYPTIKIISRNHGNFVQNLLFSVKEKFLEKINFAINAPENLLMGGLILGEKADFDQEFRQSFVDTGTIHIVALSGYNVTIVAEWLMKLFSFLSKNFSIGMGIFAIILFILMTGGSSTAIRAGIMAIMALVARATGRDYDVTRALILAGVIMIVLNPFLLVYDVSFQLSFLATFAVIFLAPRIEKYFLWVPKIFELRDIVSVTCAAYIFVFPFVLYKMGNFSLVALPVNTLILPFIPLTMMLGFLTGFAGLIWYVLAAPLGFVSYLFLHYELLIIGFFSHLSFSAFVLPDFPLLLTIFIYAYFIYRLFGRSISKFITAPF